MKLIGWFIIFFMVFLCVIGITRCQNNVLDNDMKKLGSNVQSEYQEYNTETWAQKTIYGGDSRKKAIYVTYQAIARENGISVYEAVKKTRSKFMGQFKSKFRSFTTFATLPNIRNCHKTDIDGKAAVIVHFTWEECSTSDNNTHCWTEHDEVTILETIQPETEFEEEPDGSVTIDYENFDMTIN